MKSLPGKSCRLLLSCVLALNISTAARSGGQTPAPSVVPTASLAPVASAAGALSTPPELHPAVRAVGIHNWKGEQRHSNAVYVQRGDEIWIDLHNFQGWLDSLGDRLPKNHAVKDLIL